MSRCAAFIFTTVMFVIQNYVVEINFSTIFVWIFISTLAAIGNAGGQWAAFFLALAYLVV